MSFLPRAMLRNPAFVAAGGTGFSDNFNRANGPLTSPWTTSSTGGGGVLGVQSNAAMVTSSGGLVIATQPTTLSNCTISGAVYSDIPSDVPQPGFIFRYVDINNFGAVLFDHTANTIQFFEYIAGSVSNVQNSAASIYANSTTYTFSVQASGTTFTAKLNGTTVLTATGTRATSGTTHGICMQGSFSASIDNVVCA